MATETKEQLLAHIKYERDMMRVTLNSLQLPQVQAGWNALFAAFAVYSRNCKTFLQSAGNQNDILANDYVKRFSPSSAASIKDEIDGLHQGVLHLSSRRTSQEQVKVGIEQAKKLAEWIEANLQKFESELQEPFLAIWQASETPQVQTELSPASASATNAITIISSEIVTAIGREGTKLVFEIETSRI